MCWQSGNLLENSQWDRQGANWGLAPRLFAPSIRSSVKSLAYTRWQKGGWVGKGGNIMLQKGTSQLCMKSGGCQKTVKVSLKENAAKTLFGPTSAKFAPVFSFLTCNCTGSRGKDYLQRKCTSQDICCCSDNFPQITIFHIFSKSHCALPRSPEADFERHKVAACVGEVFLDDPPISQFFLPFPPSCAEYCY